MIEDEHSQWFEMMQRTQQQIRLPSHLVLLCLSTTSKGENLLTILSKEPKKKNIGTSSSRSPISSSAAECLLLNDSSSARMPGNMEDSARNFSHCNQHKSINMKGQEERRRRRGRRRRRRMSLTCAVMLTNSSARESRIDSNDALTEKKKKRTMKTVYR